MWPISAAARAALRGSHAVTGRLTAYTPTGGTMADIPFSGASVEADGASQVRRTASLTVADTSLWPVGGFDALSPVGAEAALEFGIVLPGGVVEWVPVFRGPVQRAALALPTSSALAVDLADRSKWVAEDRLDVPGQTHGGATTISEIARLIHETLPSAEVLDLTGNTTIAPTLQIDKERWQDGVEALADSIAAEVYADASGRFIIRPQPTLGDPAVWVVDAGATGVLIQADRELTRESVYNAVIVTGPTTDGTPPVWAKVTDDDPDSPTRYGGPFGRKPRYYSSPLLTSTAQAIAAGTALLARAKGLVATVRLEAIPNPALEPGDVLEVRLPDGSRQRHIIDKVPLAFAADASQALTTRSADLPAES